MTDLCVQLDQDGLGGVRADKAGGADGKGGRISRGVLVGQDEDAAQELVVAA